MNQTPRGQPGYPMQQKRVIYDDLVKIHQCLDKSTKVPDTAQDWCHHTSGTTVNMKHAMDSAVRKLPPGALLDQLIQAISAWSTDGGRSLMQVMEDEIWVFHENMERYLDKYLEQRYEMLVEKNNDAKAHYKKLQEAVITKHKEMKATVPNDFNWELYYKDPAYLQTALHRQEQAELHVNQSSDEVRKQYESNKEWYESDLKQLQLRRKELSERLDCLQKEILERKFGVKAAQVTNANLQGQFRSVQNQLSRNSPP